LFVFMITIRRYNLSVLRCCGMSQARAGADLEALYFSDKLNQCLGAPVMRGVSY